jgi:hypothetical protein
LELLLHPLLLLLLLLAHALLLLLLLLAHPLLLLLSPVWWLPWLFHADLLGLASTRSLLYYNPLPLPAFLALSGD